MSIRFLNSLPLGSNCLSTIAFGKTMSSSGPSPSLDRVRDAFRGCMIGAVLGDCLGAPLEFISDRPLPLNKVTKQFEIYKSPDDKTYEYTDDTAMARQLAIVLAKRHQKSEGSSGLDSRALAEAFTKEYFEEPGRGYGRGVVDVFHKLRRLFDKSGSSSPNFDPTGPAREQFDHQGSLGNGGSMRVHPVALYGFLMETEKIVECARDSALVTHAHKDGVNGAILQAYAVHLALHEKSNDDILKALEELVKDTFEENKTDRESDQDSEDGDEVTSSKRPRTYGQSMALLAEALGKRCVRTGHKLGNDVIAQQSVPSAIFSALLGQAPVEGFDQECEFSRVLQIAYTFGGDTDTIGSMAGAIAGARLGQKRLPEKLIKQCEGVEEAMDQADKLFFLVYPDAPHKKFE